MSCMAVTTEMFMLSVISLMAMVMSLMQARLAGTDAGLKPTVFLYAVSHYFPRPLSQRYFQIPIKKYRIQI
jgi:hypothetical protein